MTDTACSVPWYCDDKDCPESWHLGTYWVDDGTFTYDALSDGDHEEVDALPTAEDERKAWEAYHSYCKETGTDPLRIYLCKPYAQRKVQWQALFQLAIVGVVLKGVRRRGRGSWVSPEDAPEEVREYLGVAKEGQRWTFQDKGDSPVETARHLKALVKVDPNASSQVSPSGLHIKFKFELVESRDRSRTKAYTREVKQAATAALK